MARFLPFAAPPLDKHVSAVEPQLALPRSPVELIDSQVWRMESFALMRLLSAANKAEATAWYMVQSRL